MGIWNRILAGIADLFFGGSKKEEELLEQIHAALKEEQDLWKLPEEFVDPYDLSTFLNKWESVYHDTKKKTEGQLFPFRFVRREIDELAPGFVEIYEHLPDKVQKHNEQVTGKLANDAARLILPVEGKMLDDQQLQCIVKRVRSHLILAGAGTGKTTTIIGYVKYLLKKNVCEPEDILVLSFTNASASEMSERLNAEIGIPITAQTFHKLGLEIITSVEGKRPKIYTANTKEFVMKQLNSLMQNRECLKKMCMYLTYEQSEACPEFDFQTNAEYQTYLKYNRPVTLQKEQVKSYGELDIANFLFQNGIDYVYEKEYPVDTRTSEYGQYHPDFYLPKYGLYIEYFGINRKGEVPAYFSGKNGMSPSQTYQEGIKWKRALHKQNGTRLLELYSYEKSEGILLVSLEEKLKKSGVSFMPIAPEMMWSKINGSDKQKLDRIAGLFATVLTLVKGNRITLADVREKNQKNRGNVRSQIENMIDLMEPIYQKYQEMLQENGEIDFHDMINLATSYVQSGKYQHPYRYVIVDEYQDISKARYWLLKAMRVQKDYRLFCVGDDWQSIYQFSGSDIGFILDFDQYWGVSETSRIETTYRFPQSLIDISSRFIMKNPAQKKKQLRSKRPDAGTSLEKITGTEDFVRVLKIAEKLEQLPRESSVLLLGRYRLDIRILENQENFSCKYNLATGRIDVIYAKRPDLQISFMTVHRSKGLQADYVFVLNNKAHGMGFPSHVSDAPMLNLLIDVSDPYPYAEERRLFYVALTRAKKKVWLVTQWKNESVFVKELEHPEKRISSYKSNRSYYRKPYQKNIYQGKPYRWKSKYKK